MLNKKANKKINTLKSVSTTLKSIAESIGKLPTHEDVSQIVGDAVKELPTKTDLGESFDELARMVAVGFKETDIMFADVNDRLNKIDGRLYGIETKMQTTC